MKTINFTRIRQLWLRQIQYRKKYMLTACLGTLFILYVLRFFGITSNCSPSFYDNLYYAVFCVYMAAFMAGTFSDMKTKEKRVSFLSLPATTAEKFIAYSSWHIVVPIFLFIIAVIGSELPGAITVRLLGNAEQQTTETFLLPVMVKDTLDYMVGYTQESIYIASLSIFTASLFLMGSCIWYKNVFLKTAAAIGSTFFVLLLCFMAYVSILLYYEVDYDTETKLLFFNYPYVWGFWVLYVPLGIGTVLVWWLSYRLFKQREVISQKHNWKYFFKRNNQHINK